MLSNSVRPHRRQPTTQAELFVRQRERPGLHSQAVAWPPRRSAGRREAGLDLGVAFQAPLGSQASSRGEAKDSALLSSLDADLLEPPAARPGRAPWSDFGVRTGQRRGTACRVCKSPFLRPQTRACLRDGGQWASTVTSRDGGAPLGGSFPSPCPHPVLGPPQSAVPPRQLCERGSGSRGGPTCRNGRGPPPRAFSSAPVALPRPCVQPSAAALLRAAQDA